MLTISCDQFSAERQIGVEQITNHLETQMELYKLASDVVLSKLRVIVERVYPFEQGLEVLKKS